MALSGALPIEFWNINCDTFNMKDKKPSGVFNICFCHPWESADIINLQFPSSEALTLKIRDSDNNVIANINCTSGAANTYRVSFSPRDYGITDEQIILQVVKTSNSTLLYRSDCLNVKETHDETVLIEYSNHRNFAGIDSVHVSPDPTFYLRVPAVFFEERNPEESEVIELSNSQSVQLYAQLKAQKLLAVGPMPYYMHRKLQLALSHQFVYIEDEQYIKQEKYELAEGNKRSPLRQAKVWLTEKDFIERNIL